MDPPKSLHVTSPAFQHGQPIPREHTCQGRDACPPLEFAGVPPDAQALALLMDDPDAPGGTWTHWTWWDLPPRVPKLETGADVTKLGAVEGRTDFGGNGYGGPCPPSGTHRYFFKLYALGAPLGLKPGAHRSELEKALEGRVLAWGELMGTYAKP